MGCPIVRVQGSPIGSGLGIEDPTALEDCVAHGPTVLDCGIGAVEHVLKAFALGCRGFLVDWLLFKDGTPVQAIHELREALSEAGARRPHPTLVGESDWTEEWAGVLPGGGK
jgi:thiazole synthase ThiGH ThiG subunit